MVLRNWERDSFHSGVRGFEQSTRLCSDPPQIIMPILCAIPVLTFYKLFFQTPDLVEIMGGEIICST